MSRLSSSILGAFLAASLAGPSIAQVSEFRDSEFGFAVSAPSLGAPAEGGSVMRLMVAGSTEDGFAANLNVVVQRIKTTRDAFVEVSESQFKGAGLRVISKENRVVSGRPAALIEYEGKMNGQSMHWLALAVVLPDRVLLATCTATPASFPRKEKEFRRSLDSFRLTQ